MWTGSMRTHAVTVLPSVASLKVLRGKSTMADAPKPLIGFADPVFDGDPQQLRRTSASPPTSPLRAAFAAPWPTSRN